MTPIKKIGIIAKQSIAKNANLKKILALLAKSKKEVLLDENCAEVLEKGQSSRKKTGHSREYLMNNCDLILILGGDGTILKTAGHAGKKQVLVLGVNYGNLGFLTEIKPNEIELALTKIFKKQFFLDKRSILRVTHYRKKKKINTFLALNDAVINQGLFARLIDLNIHVNGSEVATFRADGLIISTPTGSTAHSLSAGGPIVHPSLDAVVITPICPATLTMRPIVISNNKDITIAVATQRREEHNLGLTIDGQSTVPLEYGDVVKVRKSSRKFSLVRFHGANYYNMLRDKLGWGRKTGK